MGRGSIMKYLSTLMLLSSVLFMSGCGGESASGASDKEITPPVTSPIVLPVEENLSLKVDADEDFSVDEDNTFTLTGASEVVGETEMPIVRVLWTQISGIEATRITAPDQNMANYIAPQVDAENNQMTFRFEVETFDSQIFTDDVIITVNDVIDNDLPQVSAGSDLSLNGGETFTLEGTASDTDGIASVEWTLINAEQLIVINNADNVKASVKLPQVSEIKEFTFSLKAIDTLNASATDTMTVTVSPSADNIAPEFGTVLANPGVATSGEFVSLSADATDANGDELSYQWIQSTDDPFPLAIRDANTQNAQVVVPDLDEAVTLSFSVVVTDGGLESSRSTQLQIVPKDTSTPGIIECLLNLFQDGCPLQIVNDLFGDDGALRCEDPLSVECPLNAIARVSPPISECLAEPSLEGCTDVLAQLADPLFVSRSLPTPELASSCSPAFDESTFEHYTGVIHGHTGYSDGALNTRPAMAFEKAKQEGNSFMSVTDHSDNTHIPLTVTGDCFSEEFLDCLIADSENPGDSFIKWAATKEQAMDATTLTFTAFRGFEWTSDRFGHINVFFSNNVINAKTGPGYLISMGLFWNWFLYPEFLGGGDDGLLVFNHPGREDLFESTLSNIPGARDPAYAFNDFDHVPGANMRVVGLEVFGKGSEYDSSGKNGSWLSYALDKGWYVGAIGSEDHHDKDWGGSSLPKTVMIARSNTESDLKEAMQARRFYAVAQNFNDIHMDFRIDEQPMGARLGRAEGIALPARFELRNGDTAFSGIVEVVTKGNRIVQTLEGTDGSFTLNVSEEEPYYFLRVKNPETDRPVAFSSPIWVEENADVKPICEY